MKFLKVSLHHTEHGSTEHSQTFYRHSHTFANVIGMFGEWGEGEVTGSYTVAVESSLLTS